MSKVDLHIHTSISDGKYSPREIVNIACKNGLTHIAITDHDAIDGVEMARTAAAESGEMTIIPGVEINTDVISGELHILGYFIDLQNSELVDTLYRLRNSRIDRTKQMIKKLKNMGVKIDFERVEELAGDGSIGRPHIAQAMMENGYINSFKDAFLRYIGKGCPAYVERDKVTPAEAIQLLVRCGGIPVIAHPYTCENFRDLIGELKEAGLKGIETYYNNYLPWQIEDLLKVASQNGLFPTGGSDYHGLDSLNEAPLGTVEVPMECVENLMKAAFGTSGK